MNFSELCTNCFKPYGGEEVCMHCGHIQSDNPRQLCHLFPRTILNSRYLIGDVINNGGFGVVYKAYDIKLENIVAIKELLPTQNSIVNRVPGDTRVIPVNEEKEQHFNMLKQRFLEEARTMAQFNSCESIVHIFDFFEANNTAYLVMEFIDGETLRSFIEKNEGPIPLEQTLSIMIPIMEALSVVHKHKILHRDISPDNIMITSSGAVKLIDFGAARLTETENEKTMSVVLKPGYTPPEQYRSKAKIGAYTDVYAAGAVLYRMLTGVFPEESIDRVEKDELQRPSKLGVDLPSYVEKSIMKAMALRENARFKSMNDFILALNGEKRADFPEKELKRKKIIRTISAAMIFVVIALSVVGTYWFKQQNELVPVKDSEIVVWYVDDDSQKSERWTTIGEDFNSFCKVQNEELDVKVEFVAKSAENYEKELKKAFENGEGPDIYQADTLSENEFCGFLDKLYNEVDESKYEAAYAKMCEVLEKNNEVAFAFDQPVLYTYTYNSLAAEPEGDETLDELKNYKSKNKNQKYGLVVNPEAVLSAAYSYGYKDGEDNKIVNDLYECSALFDEQKKTVVPSEAFGNGTAAYYIGMMSEYSKINEMVDAGTYGFTATTLTNTDKDCIVFPETWSISKDSSTKEKQAAIFFMYFLLCENEGQTDITEVAHNTYYLPMLTENTKTIIASYDDYLLAYDSKQEKISISYSSIVSYNDKCDKISSLAGTFGASSAELDNILKK